MSELLASVDQLNSIIEVRSKFGQLGWPDLRSALEKIIPRADEVLRQAALTEETVNRSSCRREFGPSLP